MNTDEQEAHSGSSALRRLCLHLVGSLEVGIAALVVWIGYHAYLEHYESLHAYYVDGIPAMLLLALAISTLATPCFALVLSQTPDGEPKNVTEVVQLYTSVLGILFTSLSAIFIVLWILGWLRVLGYWAFRAILP